MIRDLGAHQQWQGFPKSLAVGKAIDAHHGAEREVVGPNPNSRPNSVGEVRPVWSVRVDAPITAPATDDARKWEGYGTALKPCLEPWTLARKPLDGTVAENVLKWGTGALNIDGCRYGYGERSGWPGPQEVKDYRAGVYGEANRHGIYGSRDRGPAQDGDHPKSARHSTLGRWPANVYACPKASRAEREAGCGHLPASTAADVTGREPGSAGLNSPRAGIRAGSSTRPGAGGEIRNGHPTVKPAALMAWLCRLVAGQPGSLILDPFAGSGTTGIAALREGFRFLGFELDPEYIKIAEARITGDAPLFNKRSPVLP